MTLRDDIAALRKVISGEEVSVEHGVYGAVERILTACEKMEKELIRMKMERRRFRQKHGIKRVRGDE